MKLTFKLLLIALTCNFFAYSQNLTRIEKIHLWKQIDYKVVHSPNPSDALREKWQTLFGEIFGADYSDIVEADKMGATARRVFPADMGMRVDDNNMSNIVFPYISEYFQTDFTYFNDSLMFGYGYGSNHGFIIDLGKVSIHKINQHTPQAKSLTKYKSPSDSKNIKQNLSIDGFKLENNIKLNLGHTYLCLSVIYPNHGGIYAVNVFREDSDRSIIVFTKTIKILMTSKQEEIDRQREEKESRQRALTMIQPIPTDKDKIEKALKKAGFMNIIVDTTTTPATLRGTIPKGKTQDMVKTAVESANKPLQIGTTEYNKIKRKKR